MHTVEGGGGKMEPKMLVDEDEVVDGSLGPKRWSKLVNDEWNKKMWDKTNRIKINRVKEMCGLNVQKKNM